jgi:DNA-binding response OmpR family regulator
LAGIILIVDDDADLRLTLADLFREVGGLRCVLAASLSDVQNQSREALAAGLAILDVNLGAGPSGVDVYRWLRLQGFAGEIVFLTGHASSDVRVQAAAATRDTRIISKPMDVDELVRLARTVQ